MEKWEPEFPMNAFFGLAGGVLGGAVTGAALGTIVGAGIGTAVGGVSGLLWGVYKGNEARAKVGSKVRNYKETITKAQNMYSDLHDLLKD